MLWRPLQLWTKLAQLIVLSTDVHLVRKATAVAVRKFYHLSYSLIHRHTADMYRVVQVLWRMVQLRHQRLLPDVPRLAMRQLPLLYGIDASLIWLIHLPMPQLRISTTLQTANCELYDDL